MRQIRLVVWLEGQRIYLLYIFISPNQSSILLHMDLSYIHARFHCIHHENRSIVHNHHMMITDNLLHILYIFSHWCRNLLCNVHMYSHDPHKLIFVCIGFQRQLLKRLMKMSRTHIIFTFLYLLKNNSNFSR